MRHGSKYVLVAIAATAGCGKSNAADLPLSAIATDDAPAHVPVPPADGPKLYALRDGTPILERPHPEARLIGELRAGGSVARSPEPYGKKGCEGGWYAVRPRGFVCVGPSASIDPTVAAALPPPPDVTRALPYRYARARTDLVPIYGRAPTPAEQDAAEPDLARILAWRREADKTELLGASANDVPVDARGVATGPPVLLSGAEGVEGGRRTLNAFFRFSRGDVAPPSFAAVPGGKIGTLRKHSGVAIAGTFATSSLQGERRFAVIPDGRVIPTDRLKPALGSTWHGVDLEKVGLPIAFVYKEDAVEWEVAKGRAKRTDREVERHTAVALTGKYRTANNVRYEQTRDGAWLRTQDLIVIVKRTKFPEFATGEQKWLDVSISNLTLTAYEGRKPVYATIISAPRSVPGQTPPPSPVAEPAPPGEAPTPTVQHDPERGLVRGAFRVRAKRLTRGLDTREVSQLFDVSDAPWVVELESGSAITGNYWGDTIGDPVGFKNVTLTPIDARRIFNWVDPPLPEGWHAVLDTGNTGTFVNVRP